MKTLKSFLEQTGYMKVKSPDEQKFVDKHDVDVKKDNNGNGDDVFKASKVKTIDRKKERKGYNPGEDEKVYEALKGDQHQIDANKNGKVDAHDFHLLRKKKKMKEEAEQIDELSKKTLGSYVKNAQGTILAKGMEMQQQVNRGSSDEARKKTAKKVTNRLQGVNKAVDRLTKEEAELVEGMTSADRYSATHASAKALVKSINDHLNAHKDAATKHKNSFSAKKGPTWGHVGDIEHLHGQLKDIHDRLASQGEYAANTMREGVELDEKTLTPAELKKREQVAKAMERENPGMNKSKKMAIATATAKKVAEAKLVDLLADLSETHQKTMLSVFDKLSEENQTKFVEACDTPEGVEAMLDFAIQNRGR